MPVVIGEVRGDEAGVELSQRGDLGNRDQMSAAEPAAIALDPTLLMRAEEQRGQIRVLQPAFFTVPGRSVTVICCR